MAALDEIAASRAARKRRLGETASRMRALMASAMFAIGQTKKVYPDMTVSARLGDAPLELTGDIPKEYTTEKIAVVPNMPYIREALEGGKELPFAAFGVPKRVLTIRTK